ncbi:PREDICTED: mediator of RNA polymerase II transcription subunit 20a [Camelina sativa]|nr:PREDICTED: mediator of RNA polymerase II transcription subunit 20a [Camelina sativa]
MEKSRKVMEEFLEIWHEALSKRSLPGKFVNIDLNFGEFGLGDNYTPQHTAVRYALVMAHMIATVQAVRG